MFNYKDFDSYRRCFNQMFSLSFDGKFKGLSTLRNMSQKLFDLFVHKLSKILRADADPRKRPASDIIVFRLSGHTVKLYQR